MTKIDPLSRGLGALPGARGVKRGSKGKVEKAPERNQDGIPVNVLPLVEEITEAGSALENDPTGAHFDRYKTAVRRFLDSALKESMQVSSETTLGLSQKIFSTIAKVDIALADLADAVLGRQQDVLKIKELVQQMKGIIIDLYK